MIKLIFCAMANADSVTGTLVSPGLELLLLAEVGVTTTDKLLRVAVVIYKVLRRCCYCQLLSSTLVLVFVSPTLIAMMKTMMQTMTPKMTSY